MRLQKDEESFVKFDSYSKSSSYKLFENIFMLQIVTAGNGMSLMSVSMGWNETMTGFFR